MTDVFLLFGGIALVIMTGFVMATMSLGGTFLQGLSEFLGFVIMLGITVGIFILLGSIGDGIYALYGMWALGIIVMMVIIANIGGRRYDR